MLPSLTSIYIDSFCYLEEDPPSIGVVSVSPWSIERNINPERCVCGALLITGICAGAEGMADPLIKGRAVLRIVGRVGI